MNTLTTHETTIFLIAIGLMLVLARFLSRIGDRLNVPTLVCEVLAGIILGPTILGAIFPEAHTFFFPETGHLPDAYETLFSLSVIMLLFLAGMDLDFSLLAKAKKAIIYTALFGILLPFGVGVYFAWKYFAFFHGAQFSIAPFVFPLTFGTIIAISSLPVIARILMNNNLMHTHVGMTILGTALVTDVVGWFGFSSIVIYANPIVKNVNILYTLLYIIAFFAIAYFLSGSKKLMDNIIMSKPSNKMVKGQPSYDIAMLLGICLLSGAFTNAINIHPSLGAFMAGIISKRIIGENEVIFHQLELFIMNFFAPVFFISIGLKLNFIDDLNMPMMLAVLVIAITTKLIGATAGAYLGGNKFKSACAIGVGLNARGSMEIIMGAVAMKLGLIYPQLFVSFVIVALLTSIMAEPILIRLMKKAPVT